MNVVLGTLVRRIKQRAYLDSDEEIARWIEEYCEQSNSHKHSVSGKLTDEEIWQWIKWLDVRCSFNEHQQDYIYFAIRQILKKAACASGAVDKTVSVGCVCGSHDTVTRHMIRQCADCGRPI